MKILFIGLGRTSKLFSTELLFKEKLSKAKVTGIEVAAADMEELGSPDGKKLEKNMKEKLLKGVDFIVVMEKWQKELLTHFMEYKMWGNIHLFADMCKKRIQKVIPSCDVDINYRSKDEEMNDGCENLIESIKAFIKESTSASPSNVMPV